MCIDTAVAEVTTACEGAGLEEKYVVVVQTITRRMAGGALMKMLTGDVLPRALGKLSGLPQLMLAATPKEVGAEINSVSVLLIGPKATEKLMAALESDVVAALR